jgi:DNA-binding transcriptional LysR family regulator
MRMPSTAQLMAFRLAAQTGSFKRTARLLYITPSAVSARVQALEGDLGIKLFRRGIRQLTLTEAGRAYAIEIETIFSKLATVTRELKQRFRPSASTLLQAGHARDGAGHFDSSFEHGLVPGGELL